MLPACKPKPRGVCRDPRIGVRAPDEATAKLLARTVELGVANALPAYARLVRCCCACDMSSTEVVTVIFKQTVLDW